MDWMRYARAGNGRRRRFAWIGVWLMGLLVSSPADTRAQREDTARYSAPVAGEPLCTLRIHVTGFRNDKGKAGGVVFASANGWPEDTAKSLVHGGFPIAGREATEIFRVPPGRYGVAVIHDENGNHRLDRNFLGVPKEGFGFANNPRVMLTAPAMRVAMVAVSCPVTQIEIRLIYK